VVKILSPCIAPALCIALLVSWAFCGSAAVPTTARAAEKEVGEQTFKAQCASCHGEDGSGNTPAGKSLRVPDLHNIDVQKLSDTHLAEIIAKGMGKMLPFKNSLSNDQIHSLVMYIRELAQKS